MHVGSEGPFSVEVGRQGHQAGEPAAAGAAPHFAHGARQVQLCGGRAGGRGASVRCVACCLHGPPTGAPPAGRDLAAQRTTTAARSVGHTILTQRHAASQPCSNQTAHRHPPTPSSQHQEFSPPHPSSPSGTSEESRTSPLAAHATAANAPTPPKQQVTTHPPAPTHARPPHQH